MPLNPNALPLKSGRHTGAARELAATRSEAGERWSNSGDTLSGRPHTPGAPLETGQMSRPDEIDAVRDADYVIRSYRTPIAWRTPGQGWSTTTSRYSVTTSQHQGIAAGIVHRLSR